MLASARKIRLACKQSNDSAKRHMLARKFDEPTKGLMLASSPIVSTKELPRGNVLSTTGQFSLHFVNRHTNFASVVEYAADAAVRELPVND